MAYFYTRFHPFYIIGDNCIESFHLGRFIILYVLHNNYLCKMKFLTVYMMNMYVAILMYLLTFNTSLKHCSK